jgi:hypothetical protein
MSLSSVINYVNYIIIHILFLQIFFFFIPFIFNHKYLQEQIFNIFFFKDMKYIFIRLLTYNENIYLFFINTYFYNK